MTEIKEDPPAMIVREQTVEGKGQSFIYSHGKHSDHATPPTIVLREILIMS